MNRIKKEREGHQGTPPHLMIALHQQAAKQLSIIFSTAKMRVVQDSEKSRIISNKHILEYLQAMDTLTRGTTSTYYCKLSYFLHCDTDTSKCAWGDVCNSSSIQRECRWNWTLKNTHVFLFPKEI